MTDLKFRYPSMGIRRAKMLCKANSKKIDVLTKEIHELKGLLKAVCARENAVSLRNRLQVLNNFALMSLP